MANYAVFVSGGWDTTYNYPRYANNLREMYRTLRGVYRYPRQNIFVLYADGQRLDLEGDGSNDITGPATVARLNSLFRVDLRARITSNDFLFVFTTNHGGYDAPSRVGLYLWNDYIQDRDFAALVNILPFRNLAVCMGQCHSGGLIDDLAGPNRVIATSCRDVEVAWSCDTEGDYSEFIYHWTAAVRGRTPSGQTVDADADNDGRVSLQEAFAYAQAMDSRSETPQYYEGTPGLGRRITLFGDVQAIGKRISLPDIWSAGVQLAWAQVYIATDMQPGSADLSGYIRNNLTYGRSHARAAAIFVNPEAGFDLAITILNTQGVNQRLADAVGAHLFRLGGQLRDLTAAVAGQTGRVRLPDVYSAGVNLAWAQVYTQHQINTGAVREYLNGARAHLRNANIFRDYDRPIDKALQLLNTTGMSGQTAKAIEEALGLGWQLHGLVCTADIP